MIKPKKPMPVVTGSVTATLVSELTDCFGELAALRTLRGDLAAWFKARPDLDAEFGAWQQKQRATTNTPPRARARSG